MNIRFEEAGVSFDARIALHPLTLTLSERRIGIIGLNGSGIYIATALGAAAISV